MGIIVFIVLGGIIGWIAAMLLGRQEGILASIVIGILGSFIGGYLSQLVTGGNEFMSLTLSGVLWSLIGAIVLVAILNAFTNWRSHTA